MDSSDVDASALAATAVETAVAVAAGSFLGSHIVSYCLRYCSFVARALSGSTKPVRGSVPIGRLNNKMCCSGLHMHSGHNVFVMHSGHNVFVIEDISTMVSSTPVHSVVGPTTTLLNAQMPPL